MRIKLSKNFYLDEFTRSGVARRLGVDNTPDDIAIIRLEALAELALQPIRDHFGPVSILSGYRCPVLNSAVGSTSRSAHLHGLAADFTVPGHSPREVVEWVRESGIEVDQAIDEFGEWVHLGRRMPVSFKARGQFLEAFKVDNKTRYRPI